MENRMLTAKQFKYGVIAIIATIICCFCVATEIIAGHIEKHSTHERYGNIVDASDNRFKNRMNWVKKAVFGCSPEDSC